MPRVNVVVPIYNREPYLAECLDSIAAQTFRDLAVVLVDDGSTDRSTEIAVDYCRRDERFRLFRQENGGPGRARNTGIAHTEGGEYLGFVDSDDVLAPDCYQLLVDTIESTGSDIVLGGVRRLVGDELRPAPFHDPALSERRLRTHITEHPGLFYDPNGCNKLFRRAFWDAAGLRWPEGMLFEDAPLMARAYCEARSIDVITEAVYFRRRGPRVATPSITQCGHELSSLLDRLTSIEAVDDYLRRTQEPELKERHDEKVLRWDLRRLLDQVPRADATFRRALVERISRYLDGVDPRIADALPAERRHELALLRGGLVPELVDAVERRQRR